MNFGDAIAQAFRLIVSFDPDLLEIIGRSFQVSLSAVAISALIGAPLGAAIGLARFRGRGALVVMLNSLMGLPPVVIGLIVYLMLTHNGPFGVFNLLFSPTAMIVAQTILITPLIAALARQVVEDLWQGYAEQFQSWGLRPFGPCPRFFGTPGWR